MIIKTAPTQDESDKDFNKTTTQQMSKLNVLKVIRPWMSKNKQKTLKCNWDKKWDKTFSL